jgi:hypothetical protein
MTFVKRHTKDGEADVRPHSVRKSTLIAGAALGACSVAGLGLSYAIAGSASPSASHAASDNSTTVSSTTTTAVPGASSVPPYCLPGTPTGEIAACESEHQQLATQAGELWPTSGTSISAPAAASDATSALPSSSTVGGVFSALTTYGEAGQYLEATNAFVSTSTPVWIVTVHFTSSAPASALWMGATPPPSGWNGPNALSVILDAISGKPIDTCVGCDVVQSDASLRSALR